MLTAAPEQKSEASVSVVIVTHNSQTVIGRCFKSLENQTVKPEQILIVDSGSDETGYLQNGHFNPGCTIHLRKNIGYAAANNVGISLLSKPSNYVLFINPDTFLEPCCIEKAVENISRQEDIAILTGSLKGFDNKTGRPTGQFDSTGIFRTWYGRWYDRDQGVREGTIQRKAGAIPAVCGAFMFCRRRALEPELPCLFDELFFMYKEDIDLCLRLRKGGWRLYYTPEFTAFHCRGWSPDRKRIGRTVRVMSAKNEIRLCAKHHSPYIIWALLKYVLVQFLDR